MSKIEIKGLEGLRGLSYKEIESWNAEMSKNEEYQKETDERKGGLFLYKKFQQAFGNAGNYDEIKYLPLTDINKAKEYWEKYQDYNEDYNKDIYTGYTVESSEGSPFDAETPYDESLLNPMSNILKERLTKEQQNYVEETGGLGDFDSESFIKAKALKIYDEKNYKEDPMYYQSIDEYAKEFRKGFDTSNIATYNAFSKFDSIADKISPIYKNFKNSERLGLDVNTTKDVMSYYYAIQNTSGEAEANEFLSEFMQNRIAERQGVGERYWEGFKGIGSSCYGSVVATAGIVAKAFDEDSYDKNTYNPELSNWANYWNKLIDNDLTRYGKDVTTYQTYDKDEIEKIKQSGLSGDTIFKSVKEQQGTLGERVIGKGDNTFFRTFLPSMIQQHGFTVASMFTGRAVTELFKLVGSGAKYAIKGAKLASDALKAKKVLKTADVAEDVADVVKDVSKFKKFLKTIGEGLPGFFGAGMAGTGESVTNALDSKDRLIEQGEKDIETKYNEWANPQLEEYAKEVGETLSAEASLRKGTEVEMSELEFNRRYNESIENKRKELELQYSPTKDQQLKKLEVEAVHAQNTNFAFNQAITGFLNNTFKATLMHPSVSKTLGKLFKDNTLKVAADGKWYKIGWHYIKRMFSEMFGEGVEEYSTELSDAFSRGWHGASFEHYLENGYHNVGTEGVDATIGACIKGAWDATKEAAVSTDAAYAFVSGAFSSGISTANLTGIVDTYNTFTDPNATSKDKIKAIGSIFLRSSVYEGAMTASRELKQAKNQLKALTDFASSGDNVNTHTNAVAMATFLGERNASTESELDYRNSHLGAVVSEINLLEKTKETHPGFYAKTLENISKLENLDEKSEEGKQIIEEYKHAGLAEDNSTDAEIADTIRKNAKEFSKFRKKVLVRKEENERKYGSSIDSDILDALTFGDITEEEYGRRIDVMSSEIDRAFKKGKESIKVEDRSSLNKKQKSNYIKYGNKKSIEESLEKSKSKLNIAEAKLEEAKVKLNKANRKEKEDIKKELNKYKEEIKVLKENIKNLDKAHSNVNTKDLEYLSEEDIMELSNTDRAFVMSDEYYKTASSEQKSIIDNLKKILEKGDTLLSSSEDSPVRGQSITKIKDIGILDKSIKLHEEIKVKEGKAISTYGQTIKFNALRRRQEDTMEQVGKIQDYNKFEEVLIPLLENPMTSSVSLIAAEKVLKDNSNYKRFKEKQKNTNLIFEKLEAFLQRRSDFTSDEKKALYVMGGYLAKNEIDVSDISKVEEALTPEKLKEYFLELNEGNANSNINFSLELIRELIDELNNIRRQVKQVEAIKKPIETAPTDPAKNNPTIPGVTPQSDLNPEDKKEASKRTRIFNDKINNTLQSVVKNIVEYCIENNINYKEPKILNTIISSLSYIGEDKEKLATYVLILKLNNGFNDVSINDIKEFLQENNLEESFESIAFVNEVISDADVQLTEDNKIIANKKDVTDLAHKYIDIENKEKPSNESMPNSAHMVVSTENSNDEIKEALKRHNVLKFYEEKETKDDIKEIYAVVAHDIPGLVTDSSCPIYLVVRNNNGTIKIGNLKFQVVSIIYQNDVSEGSDLATTLQRMAIEQNLHKKKKFTPIKKHKRSGNGYGNAWVKFGKFDVTSTPPTHSMKNTSLNTEISKNEKSIGDIVKRLVKVSMVVNGGVATFSYKSPFTGEEIEYSRPAKKDESNREYIAYITRNGKGIEKEIEIFVETLDKYITPSGVSLLSLIQNKDNKSNSDLFKILSNHKKVGYFTSKYINTFVNRLSIITTMLSETPGTVVNGKIKIDEKQLDIIKAGIINTDGTLKNYIYSKKATLQLREVAKEDGSVDIVVGFVVDGEFIGKQITLGTFTKVGPAIKFTPKNNLSEQIIETFKSSLLNKEGELRAVEGYPIFKIEVDYSKVENAKEGYLLQDKQDKSNDELKKYLDFIDVEALIKSNVLYHSKEEGVDRQGWTVKITKAVDSFTEETKAKKTNNTNGEVNTPKGVLDGDSGMPLDETKIIPTPIVNNSVKQALDKLVEAKKRRDEIKTSADNTSERTVETASSRNYKGNTIDPVVAAVGNIYDSVVRDLINGSIQTISEIKSKYPNIKDEEANKIFNDVKTLIEAASNSGWTLDAREMYLNTTLPSKNGEGEVEFHGIPDIVAYNSNGEIIVIDVKTFREEVDGKDINGALESWGGQTSDYGNAITKLTGFPTIEVYVFPFLVSYNTESTLRKGVLMEGVGVSSITSKTRQLGSQLLFKLDFIKQSPTNQLGDDSKKPAESIVNSFELGIGDGDMDELMKMMGVVETAEELQNNACAPKK